MKQIDEISPKVAPKKFILYSAGSDSTNYKGNQSRHIIVVSEERNRAVDRN